MLLKYEYDFWKGCNVINTLPTIIENWRKSYDKDYAFGALLTGPSKVFDYLARELLTSRLHVYGLDIPFSLFCTQTLNENKY